MAWRGVKRTFSMPCIHEIIGLTRWSIVTTTYSSPRYQISKKQWKQQDWVKKWYIWIERMSINLKSGRSRGPS